MVKLMAWLLLVEDEENVRQLLRTSSSSFIREVWVATVATGTTVISLDVALSNTKGEKIVPQLRRRPQAPMVVVTVREQEQPDRLIPAFANDGLTSTKIARKDAGQVSTGTQIADARIFRTHDLTIDRTHRLVTLGKDEIHLAPKEYELLCLLASQAGAVLPNEQLKLAIWGVSDEHTARLLRVNISNLRRKLNANPSGLQYIATEPGIGYRLRAEL